MGVIGFQIDRRGPYEGGRHFGDVGAYERIDGIVRYAVDPGLEANAGIVDLDRAERARDGLVHFDGDVTILRPTDPARANRAAIVEVPNRGRRTSVSLYNRSALVTEPTEAIDPGDGFLFDRGWTVAWCGWQWDVPRSPARMGLTAPIVLGDDGRPISGSVQLRLQLHQRTDSVDLTDHHVGMLGGHEPLPTADVDDPDARLTVRDSLWGQAEEIPRQRWRFTDPTHVSLDGGFAPGRIHDLVYTSTPCRLAGAGLLATRDFGAWIRAEYGDLEHTIVTGQSQCGRFLRTYLHLGLNCGEDGRAAYDGVLAHIAGGRRGEFNHRLAQPSVQPTPSFGHRFPFADDAQTDARTGRTDGLLETQRRRGGVPKIFYTNTASEYWRGDGSLAHTRVDDGTDIDPPGETRHYSFASTQHSPGALPLLDRSIFGSRGGNLFNIVDYTPLMRAKLVSLLAWIADGTAPPPSAVPRSDDGTAATRGQVLAALAAHPSVTRPEERGLWTLRPMDLGPGEGDGIGTWPARAVGEPYPCLVSAVDDDGNEVAGIRLPDVSVPLATHTGWNPRHPETGAPEQVIEYVGSSVPFTPEDILARYGDVEGYAGRVRRAAEDLVAEGHLLAEDIDTCERGARRRFAALMAHGGR